MERTRKNLGQLDAAEFHEEINVATIKTKVIMRALGIENVIWNKNYSSVEDSISERVESCLNQLRDGNETAYSMSGFSICEMHFEENEIFIELNFPLS